MTADRSAKAMARIEAAMRRIELAGQAPAVGADIGVEQRYQALWSEASAALGELDQLIGSLER